MIAKLASMRRDWTGRAKSALLLGTAAVAAISGYAFAIAPTVDSGRTFAGGVGISTVVDGEVAPAYTVPAGKQLTVTDVIITNTATAVGQVFIWIGNSNCDSLVNRLNEVRVPAGETFHLSLLTGFGFGAGKTVCLDSNQNTVWTVRGYLTNET